MRIIWQTVRRIKNEILGVKELSSAILFFSSLKIISLVLNLYILTYPWLLTTNNVPRNMFITM